MMIDGINQSPARLFYQKDIIGYYLILYMLGLHWDTGIPIMWMFSDTV